MKRKLSLYVPHGGTRTDDDDDDDGGDDDHDDEKKVTQNHTRGFLLSCTLTRCRRFFHRLVKERTKKTSGTRERE